MDADALLAGHRRNLEAARAARTIYVCDGGDRPPQWLADVSDGSQTFANVRWWTTSKGSLACSRLASRIAANCQRT
jgi:hypothetical protein